MLPVPIKEILNRFDDLLKFIEVLNEENKSLIEIKKEIKIVKLWQQELKADKQSVYIVGKTSTGKSEFLNLLLDINNKKDRLFKTSTKVETGIIQTLEHCPNRRDANAEIIIRDSKEFNRLAIPIHLTSNLNDGTLILSLFNSESITFFRENIIAKSNNSDSFNLIKAVERVNIKFPLKYLKGNRIIDTPGLASNISITDVNVKKKFVGKSHIIWLLDGSKRTLSDSLTLMSEEKELIKNNVNRITFVVNKFDLMEYENDDYRDTEVFKRKQELTDFLNRELCKIIRKEEKMNIYFTSFKKPKKSFANKNTHQIIKDLEDRFVLIEKEIHKQNINSLLTTLSSILKKIEINIVEKKLNSIERQINEINLKRKKILKLEKKSLSIADETYRIIAKAKNSIQSIKKEKKLNTHKRFINYFIKFKSEINKSCDKIENSVSRIEELKLKNFKKRMLRVREIKDYTFKEKETLWKKYVADSELKQINLDFKIYFQNKLDSFDKIIPKLKDEINFECQSKLKTIDEKKQKINNQQNYYLKKNELIQDCKDKIENLDKSLLKAVELKVINWEPYKKNNVLENFLNLYSLLQEIDVLQQENTKNGRKLKNN